MLDHVGGSFFLQDVSSPLANKLRGKLQDEMSAGSALHLSVSRPSRRVVKLPGSPSEGGALVQMTLNLREKGRISLLPHRLPFDSPIRSGQGGATVATWRNLRHCGCSRSQHA
ncbi:hypothetical protein IG631_09936 [Alternaria alternata]|nr:hypothetical protein IG631_09936 [Alternaria alternata]